MTIQKSSFFLAFLFYLFSIAHVVYAEHPPLHLELMAKTFSLQEGKGRAAFVVDFAPGWKVYGAPGSQDTLTYPPKVSWEGSHNLKEAKLFWPSPQEHKESQEISHIYPHPFGVEVAFTAQKPGQPVVLKGTVKLLACSTQCLPLELPFSLDLNQSIESPPPKILETPFTAQELAEEGLSLPFILLLALGGGLILNIMPCVLPVLGLKFFFFSTHKKPKMRHILRRNFLFTACGIYVSFLLLAAIAIAFKALGETVGWGIHFQNPYFLVMMIIGLSLFTANLSGLFEFTTPRWLSRFLKTPESLDGGVAFSSGILATLLATPCSAPFVGTAVGFALARHPLDIFLVFSALALGFSTPYLLASILPLDKIHFPKAGLWMIYVQRFLALCLAGTVFWLLYLLEHHQTPFEFWLTFGLFSAGNLGLFLLPRYPQSGKWLSCVCFGLLFMVPMLSQEISPEPKKPLYLAEKLSWRPLDPVQIEQWVLEGKTVFIDLTASWCITCQLNKRWVLNAPVIQDRLSAANLITMRGDWSKPNPQISSFLKKFGRAGIPFNVVIGPQAPKGIILPEILTIEAVLHALHQASGT